jgi:hypothetical protein
LGEQTTNLREKSGHDTRLSPLPARSVLTSIHIVKQL